MIRLEDTTGGEVATAIAEERHRIGSPATGMVLTLLIMADEETQADATMAAAFASQEHPMRILVVIPRKGRGATRLDADISVGGDEGPGEVAALRLRGELAHQAASVVIPLLLPDTPIVAWWPADAPDSPREDPIGMHAQRRITDARAMPRQLVALHKREEGYYPGDTDLAWTMITGWRSLLAATLDQPHSRILGAEVSLPKSHASGYLMAAWLGTRLHIPTSVVNSKGPGITNIRLITEEGEINIARPDGNTAKLTRPGMPPATIAVPRLTRGDLLAEELRRLDPDDAYGDALVGVKDVTVGRLKLGEDTPKNRKKKPVKPGLVRRGKGAAAKAKAETEPRKSAAKPKKTGKA